MPKDNHFYFSMVKSGLRIFAAITLTLGDLQTAGYVFIVAEMLGIAEEF